MPFIVETGGRVDRAGIQILDLLSGVAVVMAVVAAAAVVAVVVAVVVVVVGVVAMAVPVVMGRIAMMTCLSRTSWMLTR